MINKSRLSTFGLYSVALTGTLIFLFLQDNIVRDSDSIILEQTEMAEAATQFLETLSEEQLGKAQLPFDTDERYEFNYIPMDIRTGLMLKDMTLQQREYAHALIKSTLSNTGYLKVTGIMHLEEILFFVEGVNRVRDRDPEQYYIAVFGNPEINEPWGWRFEGHHISLNFSSVTNELFSSTPFFLGSNPAQVRSGAYAGLRVLGEEEDLGRQLVNSLNDHQLELALISETAPGEIVTSNQRRVSIENYEGLPASELSDIQKDQLWKIIEVQAHNLKPGLANVQLEQILQAGIDDIFFAWAGSQETGQPHYYRIHGPTFLYEYDNVQNDANHIHTVWRDLVNDFGEDYLLRHYESATEDHGHDH